MTKQKCEIEHWENVRKSMKYPITIPIIIPIGKQN